MKNEAKIKKIKKSRPKKNFLTLFVAFFFVGKKFLSKANDLIINELT